VPLEALLYALCESIARMVTSLKKGRFDEPVYFVGGVAANRAIIKALNEMLSQRNGAAVEVIVPEDFLHVEALARPCCPSEGVGGVKLLNEPGSDSSHSLKCHASRRWRSPATLRQAHRSTMPWLSRRGRRLNQHQGGHNGRVRPQGSGQELPDDGG